MIVNLGGVHMERYLNKDGNSGVSEYRINDYSIELIFNKSNVVYTYNEIKPGKTYVDEMKRLAKDGRVLSTYVSQVVKDNYYSKA